MLRPGGTIAYIGCASPLPTSMSITPCSYGLSYFSAHPQATAIVEDYFRVKMGAFALALTYDLT